MAFWTVIPCDLMDGHSRSEEHTAFICTVEVAWILKLEHISIRYDDIYLTHLKLTRTRRRQSEQSWLWIRGNVLKHKPCIFSHSNYFFNTLTQCTYTTKYMYYYQHLTTCFGAYLAVFRANFIVCSKLLLDFWFQIWSYNIHGWTTLLTIIRNPVLVQPKT